MKLKLVALVLLSLSYYLGGLEKDDRPEGFGRTASRSVVHNQGTWFNRYCSSSCAKFLNWICCRTRGSSVEIKGSATDSKARAPSTDL